MRIANNFNAKEKDMEEVIDRGEHFTFYIFSQIGIIVKIKLECGSIG